MVYPICSAVLFFLVSLESQFSIFHFSCVLFMVEPIISPLFDFWSCGMNDVVPYTLQQGCSVATAFMSGIVALMLSALKTSNVDIRKLSKSFVCAELNKYSTKMSNADFGDFEKFIYINPFN